MCSSDLGGTVLDTFVRPGKQKVIDEKLRGDELRHAIASARNEGFDSVRLNRPDNVLEGRKAPYETVVFDPSNIRSVNAAFDPAESGSANLMYAIDPTRIRRSDDSLDAAIERLKAAIGLTTVQGLRSMTLQVGDTTARVIPGPSEKIGRAHV